MSKHEELREAIKCRDTFDTHDEGACEAHLKKFGCQPHHTLEEAGTALLAIIDAYRLYGDDGDKMIHKILKEWL